MHSCNSFQELPDTIHKCGFFPSQIGSRIGQAQDLPLLAANMPGRPPCRLQCPPRPRPPVQSPTEKQAGRTNWSDTLGNNSAVFPAKLTKLGGDVGYTVVILCANFHLLATNSSCPKAPAFKTRRGPRGLQNACKQRKRHVTCNNTARSRALLQLFSKTARYNAQIVICPVRN